METKLTNEYAEKLADKEIEGVIPKIVYVNGLSAVVVKVLSWSVAMNYIGRLNLSAHSNNKNSH